MRPRLMRSVAPMRRRWRLLPSRRLLIPHARHPRRDDRFRQPGRNSMSARADIQGMSVIEVDEGRWVVEVRAGGLELDVLLAAGRAWAFWRWRGELLGEVGSGEDENGTLLKQHALDARNDFGVAHAVGWGYVMGGMLAGTIGAVKPGRAFRLRRRAGGPGSCAPSDPAFHRGHPPDPYPRWSSNIDRYASQSPFQRQLQPSALIDLRLAASRRHRGREGWDPEPARAAVGADRFRAHRFASRSAIATGMRLTEVPRS